MKTLLILLSVLFNTLLKANPLEPTETEALLKVVVSNFENKPRTFDIVIFKATTSGKEYKCTTDNKGNAEILLPKGDKYQISLKNFTQEDDYSTLTIPKVSGLITSTVTIKYEPAKTITLDNVYFDTNTSSVKPSSFMALDDLVSFMKIKKSLVIEIAGHTDNVGSEESNQVLSQMRAESVRNYLISKGIAAERITAKGYGEDEPIASNDSEDGRQKNRRTEIRIISE